MAFEYGLFDYFSDPVTKGDPVIMGIAKSIEPGPYLGAFYQAMGAPETRLTQKEYEVYDATKNTRDGILGATPWDNDDIAGLSVSADAAKGLTIGHVLKVGSEYVVVKAVNRANNTIEVRGRGAAGTTPAAHDAGSAFKVVSFAGADSDLKYVTGVSEVTNVYRNFIHTIFEVMDWEEHATLVRKGMTPANATIKLYRDAQIRVIEILARSCIWSRKYKALTRDERWMAAGLLQQLADTNGGARTCLSYNAAGPITDAKVKATLKEIFDRGGNPDTILLSSTNKGYFNNLLGACNLDEQLVSSRDNHTAGGVYATGYDYEGHKLRLMVDQDIPDDIIPIVTLSKCKKQWLDGDGLRVKDEPTQSSREYRKSMQGSLTYIVEGVGHDHTFMSGVDGGPTEKVTKVAIQGIGDGVQFPVSGTVGGGITATGAVSSTGTVTATGILIRQITVNADSEVPAASADNLGFRVKIGTAWTEGTKIVTAVVGEVYASNGAAWVKQSV